jgi:hypothetical protein
MSEVSVYAGLRCLGFVRDRRAGHEAFMAGDEGREIRLGTFPTLEDAKAAIWAAVQGDEPTR